MTTVSTPVGHLDPVVLDGPHEPPRVAAAHELLEDGARVVAVLPALPRLEEHGVGERQAPRDAVVDLAGELLVEGTTVAPRAHRRRRPGRARAQGVVRRTTRDGSPSWTSPRCASASAETCTPRSGSVSPGAAATTRQRPGRSHRSDARARGAGRRDEGAPRVARDRRRGRRAGRPWRRGRGGRGRRRRCRRAARGRSGVKAKPVSSGRHGPSTSIPPVTPRSRSWSRRPCRRARPGAGLGVDVERPDVPALDDEAAGSLPLGPRPRR